MAKITYEPGSTEIEHWPSKTLLDQGENKGKVSFECYDDADAAKVEAALKALGMTVVPSQCEVIAASCDLTLTAEDMKYLRENPKEHFIVNGGPFAILVQFEETPLDYLERTYTPPTPPQA
jgi:hypothetical protein